MKIFLVRIDDGRLYVEGGSLGTVKKRWPGVAVSEWDICCGSRHGKIPGTDVYPSIPATNIVNGVPLCEICRNQWKMTSDERIDRLEELVVELRADLEKIYSKED